MAYVLRRPGTDRTELRALDLEKGTSELVAANVRGGTWSHDSRGLAYNYVRFDRQPLELVVASRQLGGTELLLSPWSATSIFMPTDWSHDGSSLLGSFRDQYTSHPTIARWPVRSSDTIAPERIVLESPTAGLWQARYSPDVRWIAFVAARFPPTSTATS